MIIFKKAQYESEHLKIDDINLKAEDVWIMGNGGVSNGLIFLSSDNAVYLPDISKDINTVVSLMEDIANSLSAIANSPTPSEGLPISANSIAAINSIKNNIKNLKEKLA